MKKGLIQVLISNIVFLGIGLISNFILPRYLSMDSYSMIKTYALYITYAGFFHFGYNDGMYLKYGGKDIGELDKNDIGKNFLNYVLVLFVVSTLILTIAIIKNDFLLIMFSIGVFATNFICYFKSLAQAVGEYKIYGKSLNYEKLLALFFYIILIFLFKTDRYELFLIVQVGTSIIVAIALSVIVNKKFNFLWKGSVSIKEIRYNIKSGFVLMLGNFSSSLFTGIDRWFIKFLMPTVVFAQYAFAVSLEQILNVFITPITVSMYNYFCKNKDINNIRTIKSYVTIWGLVILLLAFPLKFIIEMYLKKYVEASNIMFILFSAHSFYIIVKGIYVNYYKSVQKQNLYFKQLIVMIITAFITNAIGYACFHSMYAIAFATLLTAFIWFLICENSTEQLKGNINNYIVLLGSNIVYLVCGFMFNPFLGLLIYFSITLILLIVFMKNDVLKLFEEIMSTIKKFKSNIRELKI